MLHKLKIVLRNFNDVEFTCLLQVKSYLEKKIALIEKYVTYINDNFVLFKGHNSKLIASLYPNTLKLTEPSVKSNSKMTAKNK